MSKKTIDEKVVSLQFDNKNFETNVATTLHTLDKLKESLYLDKAAQNMDEVGNAAERTGNKFSAMEVIFVTTVSRIATAITDKLIAPFQKLSSEISSLTVDQVSEGFQKYTDKTKSVQTIMAATSDAFEDEGEHMQFVNEQLNKLIWFTDETSYNMIDMIENISKFTSNKVELEDAVMAMEGIALEAGLSGASTQQAARAMYNFSQAMGVGSVKLQDWMSIENATMATAQFKELLMDTAYELKTIKKVSDGVYLSEGKKGTHELTVQSFRSTLQDEWLTSEVLVETLKKYSNFTQELSDTYTLFNKNGDYTTTEILHMLEDWGDESTSAARKTYILNDVIKATGYNSDQATEYLNNLTRAENKLGIEAFIASQQSKSLDDSINATKDAASSKWLAIFEYLIGDYQQAVQVFSAITEEMYDVFVAPVDNLRLLIKNWNGAAFWGDEEIDEENRFLHGRVVLMEALVNIYWNLKYVMGAVAEGFREVFPAMTAKRLFDLTVAFRDFTRNLVLTKEDLDALRGKFFEGSENLEKIKRIVQAIFSVLDLGLMILKPIISILFQLSFAILKPLLSLLVGGLDIIARIIIAIHDFIKETEIIDNTFGILIASFKIVTSFIYNFLDGLFGISDKVAKVKQAIDNALTSFENFMKMLTEENSATQTVADTMIYLDGVMKTTSQTAKDMGANFFESIKEFDKFERVKIVLTGLFDIVKDLANAVKNVVVRTFSSTAESVKEAYNSGDIARAVNIIIDTIFGLLSISFARKLFELSKDASGLLESLTDAFGSLQNVMKSMQYELDSKILLNIAKSVLIMALAILMLETAAEDPVKLQKASDAIATLAAILGSVMLGLMITINRLSNQTVTKGEIALIIGIMMTISQMAKSCVTFAIAIKILSTVRSDLITLGVNALLTYIYACIAFLLVVSFVSRFGVTEGRLIDFTFMLVAITKMMKVITNEFFKLVIAFKTIKDPVALVVGMSALIVYLGLVAGFLAIVNKLFGKKTPLEIKAMEKLMISIGTSMKSICSSFLAVAAAAYLLGKMDRDALIQGGIAIGLLSSLLMVVIVFFSLLVNNPSLNADGNQIAASIASLGGAFAALSIGLLLISASVAVLGKMKLANVVQGIIALMALLAVAYLTVKGLQKVDVTKLTQLAKGMLLMSLSMLSISASLLIFTMAITALGTIGSVGLIAAVEAIRVLLSGMIDVIIEQVPRLILALVNAIIESKTAVYEGVVQFLDLLIEYVPQIIDKAIDVVILILDGIRERLPELSEKLAEFLAELFKAGLVILHKEGAIQGLFMSVGLIGAIATISRLLASMSSIGPKAMVGAFWASAIIAEILAIFSAIGMLYDYIFQGQEDAMIQALNTAAVACTKVGEIIGGFLGGLFGSLVGGVIDGVLDPIMNSLPDYGQNIADFWSNVEPFVKGIKEVSSDDIDSAKKFADMLVVLASAEVIDSIAAWINTFTGGENGDINSFATNIKGLGVALSDFSSSVSGKIDTESIDTASAVAVELADFVQKVQAINISEKWYSGSSDVTSFAGKMVQFGKLMISYNDAIKGIDWDTEGSKKSVEMAGYVVDLTDKIPRTGGIWQQIIGEKDIAKLGGQITTFANQMIETNKLFGEGISWDEEDFKKVTELAQSYVELADAIPRQDGWAQQLLGEKDLANFGMSVLGFVEYMLTVNQLLAGKAGFVMYRGTSHEVAVTGSDIADIDTSKMDKLKSIGMTMTDLAKELNNSANGWTTLNAYATDLIDFTESLIYYSEHIAQTKVYKTIVSYTNDIAQGFISLVSSLDGVKTNPLKDISDCIDILCKAADPKKNDGDFEKLGKKLNAFAGYLPDFVDNLKKFDDEDVDKGADAFSHFIDVLLKGNDIDSDNWYSFASAMTILNESTFDGFISLFASEVESTNKAMDGYMNDISDHLLREAGKPYRKAFNDLTQDGIDILTNKTTLNNYETAANGIMRTIRQAVYNSSSLFSTVFNNVLKGASSYATDTSKSDAAIKSFTSLGNDIINGLIGGMNEKVNDLNKAINLICESIPGVFKDNLKINSPSKVMIAIGECIPEGLAEGIDDGLSYVSNSLNTASNYVIANSIKMRDKVMDAMSDGEELTPTISPIFDFNGFDNRRMNLTSSLDLNIRRPMDGLTNRILDAQSRIEASNNRVVDSINMLRQDVKDLSNQDRETNLYVDSTKLASTIAKPMDRQLNILAGRRR